MVKQETAQQRKERLNKALRANLQRRKATIKGLKARENVANQEQGASEVAVRKTALTPKLGNLSDSNDKNSEK